MPTSESFKNVMTGLAALAVPIAVAYLANYYSASIKDKDVGVKFVELAITILSKDPNQSDANIRRWATKILERYSDVPLGDEARKDIIDTVPLPKIRDTPIADGSRYVSGLRAITQVIVRDTQQDDFQKEIAGLQEGRVAYHYLIAKDGAIHRLADENNVAFHTAGRNQDSIGIGLLHVSGSTYETAQIDALRNLLSDIVRRRSIPKTRIFSATDVDPSRRSDFGTIREVVTTGLP